MRTVRVITHPEATHHIEGVVGGWHDSELTPAGIQAASLVARTLRSEIPDGAEVELFSSDLARTRRTAEEIAGLFGVDPILDRRLREKSFGEAEGKPRAWLDDRYLPPPAFGDRLEYDQGVPGAESTTAVARRLYTAMDEILGRPCEQQVIVTHGHALTFVVAAWIRMPIESLGYVIFRASAGSISTLQEDDFYRSRRVVRLGDTRHLES